MKLELDANRFIRYAVGGLLITATILKPLKAYSTVLGIAAIYLILTAGAEVYPETRIMRF